MESSICGTRHRPERTSFWTLFWDPGLITQTIGTSKSFLTGSLLQELLTMTSCTSIQLVMNFTLRLTLQINYSTLQYAGWTSSTKMVNAAPALINRLSLTEHSSWTVAAWNATLWTISNAAPTLLCKLPLKQSAPPRDTQLTIALSLTSLDKNLYQMGRQVSTWRKLQLLSMSSTRDTSGTTRVPKRSIWL